MEEGNITVSRISGTIVYPANFLLVAATNPCPCGFYGSKEVPCACNPQKIKKYQSTYSGPFRDRIDLEVEIFPAQEKERKRILISLEESRKKFKKQQPFNGKGIKEVDFTLTDNLEENT